MHPIPSPFPAFVCFEVVGPDDTVDFELSGAELSALSPRAVKGRRLHFAMGRCAARRALHRLTGQEHSIPRAEDGRPLWPEGVVGAITHAGDIGAAAVAPASDCCGIGLDIEELSRTLKADISRIICTDAEQRWVNEADRDTRMRMIFSAKESVFKALYPLEQVFLGFMDAELTWEASESAFVARLQKHAAMRYPSGSELRVRCEIHGDRVVSSAVAP